MNKPIPEQPMSRMAAIFHFFDLNTTEEKKEYTKLKEEDRKELGAGLEKLGYKINPQ